MHSLKEMDIIKLQSKYMQQDPTTKALCAALNSQLAQVASEADLCLVLPAVKNIPERILDSIAFELHIDWYDAAAPLDVKQALVKNSDKVHMYLGTPYAVEQVIHDYFGDGYVIEWFEYGGQPYHYKVVTSNPAVSGELAGRFVKAVEKVQNIRSRLEQVIISMSAEMDCFTGNAIHTGDYYTVEQVV